MDESNEDQIVCSNQDLGKIECANKDNEEQKNVENGLAWTQWIEQIPKKEKAVPILRESILEWRIPNFSIHLSSNVDL